MPDTWTDFSNMPLSEEEWENIKSRRGGNKSSLCDVDLLLAEVVRLRQIEVAARELCKSSGSFEAWPNPEDCPSPGWRSLLSLLTQSPTSPTKGV